MSIPTRKRILDEIDLDEISIVDSPMVEPARVAILKRRGDNGPLMSNFAKRVALTSMAAGHAHSVLTSDHVGGEARIGTTSYVDGHAHDWITDEGGNIVIAEAAGHAHGIAVLMQKGAEELFKNLPEGSPLASLLDQGVTPASATAADTDGTKGLNMTPEEKAAIEKKAAEEKKAELLLKRAERAEQVVSFSPEQRNHFDALGADAQAEFLGKSADERSAIVKNAQDSDPIVYTATDGRTFRKSADSNLLAEVQRGDRQEKVIADGVKLQKRAAIEKRAGEELKHLSGEGSAKADLLEAVETLPAEKQAPVLAILKAQDAGMATAMTRIGATGDNASDEADPADQLETLAKKIAKDEKIPYGDAFLKATDTPEGRELYRQHVG